MQMENRLLNALPPQVKQRIADQLERVPLELGQVLYRPEDAMRYVYFPIDSIVSLTYLTENGTSAEFSVVGNEGMMGIALFMGGNSTISQAVVRNAGHAYRMLTQGLQQEFANPDGLLRLLMLRYTQALIKQMAQTAVCNRQHSIQQQLCRWILLSLDQLSGNQLTMSPELVANLLGVSRPNIAMAASQLQGKGLIEYNLGSITVLDRPGLAKLSCECYFLIKKETDRLLPYVH